MAVTLAEVSIPNYSPVQGDFLGMKARLMDVTFDNSYLTGGEVVTAAQLGWDQIQMVFCDGARGAAGVSLVNVIAVPNAARTQVALQAYETAGTVDLAHKEVSSAQDLSTFTARVLFLGN